MPGRRVVSGRWQGLRGEALWLAGLFFLGGGCDSLTVDRAPAGTFPPQSALCGVDALDQVVQAWCLDFEAHCESRAHCCQPAGYPGTVEQCVAQEQLRCREVARDNLLAGACFLPGAQSATCSDRWREAASTCDQSQFQSTEFQAAWRAEGCDNQWTTGALREREPCSSPAQCLVPSEQYTARCVRELDNRNFACRAYPLSDLGQRCLFGASCPGPSVCGASGVCRLQAGLGQPCEGAVDCESGLCSAGQCAAASGKTCDRRADCGSGMRCREGRCEATPLATDNFCNFGPPQGGHPECHLSTALADTMGTAPLNCTGFALTEALAAVCIVEARQRGVDAYFVLASPYAPGADFREALVYPAGGGKRALRYTEDDSRPGGVVLEQVQCKLEGEGFEFRRCDSEHSAQVLCQVPEEEGT